MYGNKIIIDTVNASDTLRFRNNPNYLYDTIINNRLEQYTSWNELKQQLSDTIPDVIFVDLELEVV